MSKLHSPVKVGPYEFSHRVVLAPLTRMRAEEGAKPGPLMAEYYAQRTSEGGFLIGDATVAAPNGNGYLGAPGLYDDGQIAGWKLVTDAVHAKGGRIFLQLYHAGRQSNSQLQPGGAQPVAPSAVPHGGVAYTEAGWVPNTPSRALTIPEIAELVESGVAEGAVLHQQSCALPERGWFHRASFFTGVSQSHRIAREEIFGPVLSIMTFRTADEAIERANNLPYGLSAGIWTASGQLGMYTAARMQAGVVWCNTFNQFDPSSPFGGYKESGFGREGGLAGLRDYLR